MSFIKKKNPFTGEIEIEIEGVLKSTSASVMKTKNILKRPYRIAKVEVTYPDGTKGNVDSLLFESIRKKSPQYFSVYSNVTLKVFTEGENKGYSQIIQPKTLQNLIYLSNTFKSNIIWVSDNFRTNLLSLLPGGFCVIIEYCDGSIYGYDKIKFKELYIQKILYVYFSNKEINLEESSNEEKLQMINIYLSKIYFKEYTTQSDYDESDYELFWSNENSEFLPWE